VKFGWTGIAKEWVPYFGAERRDAGESSFDVAELYRSN
jgi:hypothetical protein